MPYFDPSQRDEPFSRIGARLASDVESATERLQRLGESEASAPRAPGKWSPKEILGHLIDSASNNHQRFVRAQLAPSLLRIPGYEQERWVVTQRYSERPWLDLVELWSAYNRHLAHVIAGIPEDCRHASCEIGGDPPVTLVYVALDYVGHIGHHMRQIFG
jgi:hypothetical protein